MFLENFLTRKGVDFIMLPISFFLKMKEDLNELIFVMSKLHRFFVIHHGEKGINEHLPVTKLQVETMRYIHKNPFVVMGNVSQYLNMSMSSTTQLVERLTKSKLISRKGDKTDHRVIHLELTSSGKKMLKFIEKKVEKKIKKIFTNIPVKDIRELIRINKNLLKKLEEKTKSPTKKI